MSPSARQRPDRSLRVRTPLRQRIEDLLRGPVQFIAWLGLGVTGLGLGLQESAGSGLVGLAVASTYEARAQQGGLVAELHVGIGSDVQAGQVLAMLDSGAHGLAVDTSRRELAALAAEIDATLAGQRVAATRRDLEAQLRGLDRAEARQRFEQGRTANVERQLDRRSRLQVENRRLVLSLRTLEAEQAGRELVARRARQEATRARTLADGGVDRRARALDLNLTAESLEAETAASEVALLDAREQLARSTAELEALSGAAEDPEREPQGEPLRVDALASVEEGLEKAASSRDLAALELLDRRLAVARADLAELEARGELLSVRAPVAGRVVSVRCAPGSVLLAGEALLSVQPQVPEFLTVFLPESAAHREIPESFRVARRSEPGQSGVATVLGAEPRLAPLPAPLQTSPTQVQRGRAVHLSVPEGLRLLPGERLHAVPSPTHVALN